MSVINDNGCGWLIDIPKRSNIKHLDSNISCDYLIVGAGYTGLSAARQLSKINKKNKIVLVDAQIAGEGASSRNSGYLVDTTLNDGFTSNKDINNYKKKVKIYELGIKTVKKFIKEFQVDCDWNECGKYFASSKLDDKKKINSFIKLLSSLNFKNKILFEKDLHDRLGTNFYKVAVYTDGGILLNPAKLVRAMVDMMPDNVDLYENSPLISWKKINNKIICKFKFNSIEAQKIIFCTNGFLNSLGVKKNYTFPICLTASMTRSLTKDELNSIGNPNEWGVLPIRSMGATIRLTKDNKILIRNTAEFRNPDYMSENDLKKRIKYHKLGIQKRFPNLPKNLINASWSGIVCRSRNSSQIFEKIDNQIYVAGCYNGSGIGVGTFFGEQIALMASNQQSEEIKTIEERVKPKWLPPKPFLNIGVKSRLLYESYIARSEI